jgi:acyl carrier protein
MGLDSVELVMAFEEEFHIDISNAAAEKMATPRDVLAFVMAERQRQELPADPEQILEKIRDITVLHANVRREDVTLDAHFIHDLGLD